MKRLWAYRRLLRARGWRTFVSAHGPGDGFGRLRGPVEVTDRMADALIADGWLEEVDR